MKNRVKSSKIELRFREIRSEGCTSCSPVLQALIYLRMHFYGSASAEPFFAACFSGELGSTTAHLRRLPRKGRAGGAYKTLLKHRVQGAALPAMLPSSPSADFFQYASLRLCFGRAVFVLRGNPPQKGAFPLFLRGRLCYTIIALVRAARAANRCVLPKVAYPGQGARKRLSFEKG